MKKRGIIISIFIIGAFLAVYGLIFIRLHNSVKVKPMGQHMLTDKVIAYRQDEEAWAMDYLGNSSYTMKSSGCLVTCIAVAVSVNGETVTPGELNKLFSENAAYDSEGNIQWSRLEAIDGYNVSVFGSVSNADIEKCLSDNHYPIVRVRMSGIGNYHYVLIVGADESDYLCMDPLQDNITKLSDYWGRVYAVRCVWKD